MQNQFGQAGKSTREGGQKRRSNARWIAIGAVAVAIILLVIYFNSKALGLGGGAIIVLLVVMKLIPNIIDKPIDRQLKAEKRYNRGAKAEETVGQLLAQLEPDQYVVLHDWRSPYGNIDHIVHDKFGNIFMIETKSHGGRVTPQGENLLLNGHEFEKNIIHQSLSNSIWMKNTIEQKLGVTAWITPVIVFTNAFVEFGRPIKGVYYTNKKYLLKFIRENKGSSPAGLKLWEMRKI